MLIEIKFTFKITRQMVIYNRFKNFRKIFKKRYKSINLHTGLTTFLLTDTINDNFHCVGKYCCDSLRLKIYLSTKVKQSHYWPGVAQRVPGS